MRFRPANISLINRRHYLPRLLLTLSSKGQIQKPPQRFEDVDRVTPYQLPDRRPPCKSVVKRRRRCSGTLARACPLLLQDSSGRMHASRHSFLLSAEPDIYLLSRAPKSGHRRLSLCSLPVPKQFEESLGSISSFTQSAIGRTWQSARR
jgi:hypothetical protein